MKSSSILVGTDGLIAKIMEYVTSVVVHDSGPAALGLLTMAVFFHIIQGAAELADGAPTRLIRSTLILRLGMTAGIMGAYSLMFIGPAESFQKTYLTSFATRWSDIWTQECEQLDTLKKNQDENQDLKADAVSGTNAGPKDDSIAAKIAFFLADTLITTLGSMFAALAGLVTTAFILMEGFYCLGMTAVLLMIGPICLAGFAHEKTEAMGWSFLRTFFVLGVCYMPMLGHAAAIGGYSMSVMATLSPDVVFGDGSDLKVHLLLVFIGPIAAFAVVRAVPALLTSLLQGAGAGGGAAGSMITSVLTTLATMIATKGASRGGGGGGSAGAGGSALGAAQDAGRRQAGAQASASLGSSPPTAESAARIRGDGGGAEPATSGGGGGRGTGSPGGISGRAFSGAPAPKTSNLRGNGGGAAEAPRADAGAAGSGKATDGPAPAPQRDAGGGGGPGGASSSPQSSAAASPPKDIGKGSK